MKTVLVLDSSQINEAIKCHHMWALNYREHLSNATNVTTALDEGTLMHALLDVYYTLIATGGPRLNIYTAAQAAVVALTADRTFEAYLKDKSADRWEFLVQRFMQYVARYSSNDFQPIINKGRPSVEVGFSKVLFEDSKRLFIVEGRIDLISTINGERLWMDHKTQSTQGNLYKYKSQFLTYAWATGYKYGIINYIRLHAKYDDRHTLVRETIQFPQHLILRWEERMLHLFFELAKVIESSNGDSEHFKREPGACAGAFEKSPCQYTQICETESAEMREQIKKFHYIKRTPWSPW